MNRLSAISLPLACTAISAVLPLLPGCGYHPTARERPEHERFCVATSGAPVADAAASAALEAGARQVLARAGALSADCARSRRVVLRLHTLEALAEAVVSVGGVPQARGARVRAVAAAVVDGATTELQAEGEAVTAVSEQGWSQSRAAGDARAAAGRAAGERLARGLLGEPIAGP